MIVATAGHVDHGKTSLVRALTGIDTDRLAEEKRRGMSIDLGFAHAALGPAGDISFVDVPGHERFVRNMLAGVAGIDQALLVVAADDGPMPQTLEHLAILGLLGVAGCTVVLTKIDRVPAARCAQVCADIRALLAAGPYHDAPLFPVNLAADRVAGAAVLPGLAALRDHLAGLRPTRFAGDSAGHFRLVVDRSFTRAGAGRIVTGTVLSGRVIVGDAVVLSPQGAALRVRAVQLHSHASDGAQAGQRCALNLAGADLKRAEPQRGNWVVAPAAHAPTGRFDAHLMVLGTAARPLAHRSGLQLHIGAACVEARLATLDTPALSAGDSGCVQLVLAAPVAALRGDRFILRDPTAHCTLAGGVVLDPFAPARGRTSAKRARLRAAWAEPDAPRVLTALLEAQPEGLAWHRFVLACNLRSDEASALAQVQAKNLRWIPRDDGPWVVSVQHWQALGQHLVCALARWHADQPDSLGPGEQALARQMDWRGDPDLLRAALQDGVERAALARDGLRYRLSGHRAVLAAPDAALLRRVVALLQPTGLRPPIVGELVSALGLSRTELLDFLHRAAERGQLVRLAANRYFLPQTVADLVDHAGQLAQRSPDRGFDAAEFRDRTGIGRNLSVQVLEFMDREGLTRFDGQRRRLLV